MKFPSLIIVCIIAFDSIVFTSCNRKNKECQQDNYSNYEFNLPFYYTPNTDTFRLGDTLWIESTFNKQLYNEVDGKTYTLNNFNFGMDAVICDFATNPTIGYSGFVLVDTEGQVDNISKNGPNFVVDYRYSNGTYYWKIGIKMNKTGAFYIGAVSVFSYDNLSKSGQNITKCPNEFAIMRGKPMNVTNNYYLVQTSPDPYIKQGEDAFKYCYIFYVKE